MARVFISYPNNERQIATRLAKALQGVGLEPVMDVYDATVGEEVLTHLLYSVHSSDFVLLLTPTKSLSQWRTEGAGAGAGAAIRQKLKSRNVSIVPVFLGRRPLIPGLADFVSFYIDERNRRFGPDGSIHKIATYMANLPRVEFNRLSSLAFEALVVALLKKFKFIDIESGQGMSGAFDFEAKTRTRNPFGGFGVTSWVFKIKFHKNSRADISSLSELSHFLQSRPLGVNGVLITNGQLTSTAREWIESNEESKRISIAVVDGTQLRELVLKYPDVIDMFFGRWV
jgi:hypothetical protein